MNKAFSFEHMPLEKNSCLFVIVCINKHEINLRSTIICDYLMCSEIVLICFEVSFVHITDMLRCVLEFIFGIYVYKQTDSIISHKLQIKIILSILQTCVVNKTSKNNDSELS